MPVFDIFIVGSIAVGIPIAILSTGIPPVKAAAGGVLAGVGLAVFGIVGVAFQGDDLERLIRFERTTGFGRSFVAGVGFAIGSLVIFVVSAVKWFISKVTGSKP